MNQAAFTATFADWKLVKTRGVVQLVFEVPVEKADAAYNVLGGMPDAAQERWFAIARLTEQAARNEPVPASRNPVPASASLQSSNRGLCFRGDAGADREAAASPSDGPASRPFTELKYSQQAGILCSDPAFHQFLEMYSPDDWRDYASLPDPKFRAKLCVRRLCGVDSRADILPDTPAAAHWQQIVQSYRGWSPVTHASSKQEIMPL